MLLYLLIYYSGKLDGKPCVYENASYIACHLTSQDIGITKKHLNIIYIYNRGIWFLMGYLQLIHYLRVPQGLEDVSKYPDLVAELLKRGWKQMELEAALANNLIRVFRDVEQVSS